MMAEGEERKQFQTGDKMEDMMGYARKLNALGDVVMTMFWIGNSHNIGETEFVRFGQELGEIIMDYSQGLEIMLDESSRSFVDLDKDVVFPLRRCKEVYEWSSKNRHKPDVVHIDYQLNELKAFIENAAIPAMQLKSAFEELKKDILAKQKITPATVAAAAGV